MLDWPSADIRRELPEYVVREGDVVYAAPYRATQADLNAYFVQADVCALQEHIDVQLNEPVRVPSLRGSQCELRFFCVDPWVVFIYASLRSVTSVAESDGGQGFFPVHELSVWIPIIKQQTVAGALITESAWFLPRVYTDPTASVVAGREVYGYPKVPACFKLSREGLPIAVQAQNGLQSLAQQKDYFCAPLPAAGERTNPRLSAQSIVAQAFSRYLANHPVVFRKQAALFENTELAHGVPQARYTALVESRMPITRLRGLHWSECSRPFTGIPASVMAGLGLHESPAPSLVSIRGCTVDIQQGREIWVSKKEQPVITHLQAFDEPPQIRSTAFCISAAPSAEAEPSLSAGPNILRGTAEAYFASARPQSIAALLERHFRQRRKAWGIEPDGDRDFVMLLFLRAEDNAAVRLYEFGVWVPIKHGGTAAWYVPYMVRSPGAAVVHAREWFGHSCQEGFIEYSPDKLDRSVEFRQPAGPAGPGVPWTRSVGVALKHVRADVPCHQRPPRPSLPQERSRVVGLRQNRHAADTTRACVQELVTSDVHFHAKIQQEPVQCRVSLSDNLRLGRLMNLDGDNAVVPGWRLEQLVMTATVISLPEHSVHDHR